MSKILRGFLITLIISFFNLVSTAQPMAFIAHKFFETIDEKAYLEVYIDFSAETFHVTHKDSTYSQSTLVTGILYEGDSIIGLDKKIIQSPLVYTVDELGDFIGVLRLQALHRKNLNLHLSIEDLNNKDTISNKVSVEVPIKPYPYSKSVHFSDILFIGDSKPSSVPNELNKSGTLITPYISSYFPQEVDKIKFYAELYFPERTLQDSNKYIGYVQVSNPETKEVFQNVRGIIRLQPDRIVPLISSLDISKIPNGNFLFEFELRNEKNDIVCKQSIPFERTNPKITSEEIDLDELLISSSFIGGVSDLEMLSDYINSLRPIASKKEQFKIDNQDTRFPDVLSKQRFFLQFWMARSATAPDRAWLNYLEKVQYANELFTTNIRKGYESDRGRVFLKYGSPNQRTEVPSEPSAYPYEIWQYYQLNGVNNIKFIFYSTSLVNNEYILLHSNYPGETRNTDWKNEIFRRNSGNTYPNQPVEEGYGNRVDDYFANPR